ncbi:MAG: ABC transporter ATP-binding protein, partial [Planctomycetota bacterium]
SLSVMRLLPKPAARIAAGSVRLFGEDMLAKPEAEVAALRGSAMSMIFQEPGTSLNPVYKAGWQVAEAIRLHDPAVSADAARERAIKLFDEVGIPEPARRVDSYPHEMSGGQKQRVMIAMALANNPKLLIADEPTTALDVTIQKQILDLLRKLRDERGMAILFITHDLGVIAELADRVAVMFRGEIVETGPVKEIFADAKHPYTRGLLACRPRLGTRPKRLATVADFLEGTGEEKERSTPDPRLLHPQAELKRLGFGDTPGEKLATLGGFNHPDGDPVLSVRNLTVTYPIYGGVFRRQTGEVRAVDDVSFDVYRGQTLGLVGESGCGKTTTGRAILRLLKAAAGTVTFDGRDVFALDGDDLRALRRKMQVVFQDPFASLNPRRTVGAAITEPMRVHGLEGSQSAHRDRAAALLEEVGLEAGHLTRFPHEFSGGQRQRVCIARALAVEPEFLILDESVSARDVSVQAQVLNLLLDLRDKRGLTYIFISHDLSVVKFMADMTAVMRAGKIVEYGPSDAIYAAPKQAYTRELIAAIPDPDAALSR